MGPVLPQQDCVTCDNIFAVSKSVSSPLQCTAKNKYLEHKIESAFRIENQVKHLFYKVISDIKP